MTPTKEQLATLKGMNEIIRELNMDHSAIATSSIDNRGSVLAMSCVTFCVLTLIVVVLEFYRQDTDSVKSNEAVQLELHDLRAWKDIHQREITDIQSRLKDTK